MACEKRSAGFPAKRWPHGPQGCDLAPAATTSPTPLAMRTLGRRVLAIQTDTTELDTLLANLVETTAGVGPRRHARPRARSWGGSGCACRPGVDGRSPPKLWPVTWGVRCEAPGRAPGTCVCGPRRTLLLAKCLRA